MHVLDAIAKRLREAGPRGRNGQRRRQVRRAGTPDNVPKMPRSSVLAAGLPSTSAPILAAQVPGRLGSRPVRGERLVPVGCGPGA